MTKFGAIKQPTLCIRYHPQHALNCKYPPFPSDFTTWSRLFHAAKVKRTRILAVERKWNTTLDLDFPPEQPTWHGSMQRAQEHCTVTAGLSTMQVMVSLEISSRAWLYWPRREGSASPVEAASAAAVPGPQSRRYPWNKTNKLARAQTHSRASNFKLSYISPTTAAVLETGHWKILGLFVRHDCTNQQLYSLRCNLPQLPPTLTQLGLANASFSAKSVWRESKKRPVSAPRSWISRYLD